MIIDRRTSFYINRIIERLNEKIRSEQQLESGVDRVAGDLKEVKRDPKDPTSIIFIQTDGIEVRVTVEFGKDRQGDDVVKFRFSQSGSSLVFSRSDLLGKPK